jgi:hypothetical protein
MKVWLGFLVFLWLGYSENQPSIATKRDRLTREDIITRIYDDREKLTLCDGEIDRAVAEEASAVYPLTGDRYLVQFLCFMGAYQGNYQYYLYKSAKATFSIAPLPLEIIENTATDRKTPIRSIGGVPEYNPEQQLLTVHTKYRGLGDCGTWAQYRWDQKAFQLLEYRVKETCDGQYVDPDRYFRVYP